MLYQPRHHSVHWEQGRQKRAPHVREQMSQQSSFEDLELERASSCDAGIDPKCVAALFGTAAGASKAATAWDPLTLSSSCASKLDSCESVESSPSCGVACGVHAVQAVPQDSDFHCSRADLAGMDWPLLKQKYEQELAEMVDVGYCGGERWRCFVASDVFTPGRNGMIEELIAASPPLPTELSALDGEWELVFTNVAHGIFRSSPFFLAIEDAYTRAGAPDKAQLFFKLHELQTCSWGISKIGRVAQRIDASEGLLYSEFDTNLLSLTTIPVIGFWKLLPTFGGCVVTVSSAAYDAANGKIDMEVQYTTSKPVPGLSGLRPLPGEWGYKIADLMVYLSTDSSRGLTMGNVTASGEALW